MLPFDPSIGFAPPAHLIVHDASGAKVLDYDKLREEQKKARQQGRLLGVGIVVGVEPGGRNAAREIIRDFKSGRMKDKRA